MYCFIFVSMLLVGRLLDIAAIQLAAAELGKGETLAAALDIGQTPRKCTEGALKQAGILEARHELEENIARLGRLQADQRGNRRTLRNSEICAIKGCMYRGLSPVALCITTRVNAKDDNLARIQDLGEGNNGRRGGIIGTNRCGRTLWITRCVRARRICTTGRLSRLKGDRRLKTLRRRLKSLRIGRSAM